MNVKIGNSELELDVISLVNGVLIGVDVNIDESEYECEDDDCGEKQKNAVHKKRLKKDPEDNIGSAISIIDTDSIERGVDFDSIKRNIDGILKNNGWTFSEFFKNDDIIAEFCRHYEYNLKNFIRLMVEHMPDVVNINFLRSVVRPTVTTLQKLKNEFENGNQNTSNGTVGYRRIFAYM